MKAFLSAVSVPKPSDRPAIQVRNLLIALYAWMTLGWTVAAVLRLTIRDLGPIPLVSGFYYASPGPLLFLLALFLGMLCLILGRPRRMACWGVLALVVAQSAGSHRVVTPALPDVVTTSSQRLLLWNVCHGRHGWQQVVTEIQKYDPDIITLVEAGPPTEEMRQIWESGFPEHEVTLLGGEMVLLIRGGTAHDVAAGDLGIDGHYRQVEVSLGDRDLSVLFVDIHGRPDYDRAPAMNRLAELIDQTGNQPLLIAGDFNTPRESPLFQPIDERTSNAYDSSGRGFQPTWPWPLPLLTLDQVWSNAGLSFDDCFAGWSSASDHRPVIADFRLLE
ncbi:endonuclease/exonuclease/phosphatase family protein [Rubinisphaera margarita]|uniref:endonuclease/exonuclease/phosphatase family protein n=1 Tax=Rubinisphaera margarita TaxID=2909586 RepID=UPI001EE86957|nr:endonuclease/exonuclease/phosphatase family protein [Rubinisphaera margarita]MCG6157452.1 endonuclease/exonuclease/phosphatase family protein [Rubinisphaera margarita]